MLEPQYTLEQNNQLATALGQRLFDAGVLPATVRTFDVLAMVDAARPSEAEEAHLLSIAAYDLEGRHFPIFRSAVALRVASLRFSQATT
jgi:hypothetical protein